MRRITFFARLRFKQIRIFSGALLALSSRSTVSRLARFVGKSRLIDHLLFGFRRTFSTFEEAARAAERYPVSSHEHSGNIAEHAERSHSIRSSDYPVLFHLQKLLHEVSSVLDIGGSVGNLFYSYANYLEYPRKFTWTVCELPRTAQAGRQIAETRNETRIRFVEKLDHCSSADLVVISGALHYFEALPPELTRFLTRQPKYVLINRTPVTNGSSAFTLQDHHQRFAISPADILSRKTLLDAMTAANYELVDEWMAPELKLQIPLHPDASASSYSGFFFRARQVASTLLTDETTGARQRVRRRRPASVKRPTQQRHFPTIAVDWQSKSGSHEGLPDHAY